VGFAIVAAFIDLVLRSDKTSKYGEENMATIPKDFRRVIVAASVGNVIEWYDFYIFGSLAAILSVKFFEQSNPVAALLSTIALFTAGFLIRPLGAFLFGWMGDRVGRKSSIRSSLP
jgi:MFS family permease